MYTFTNYKTKKAMREAFEAGEKIAVYQPGQSVGFFPDYANTDGRVAIEGPHYPEPHRWYASVEIKDSVITRIIS